jgi:serine/threonine-protein kinase
MTSGATPPPSDSQVSGISPDLTGRTLGDFQIIRKLGKGGMAEVYLAEQLSLKRQVALKVLRAEFVTDATYVKRFRHEATAAGALNHPNIVQVYSIGEQEGIHFIAQEYVRGGNLKDFLRKKGPLEWNLTLFLMKQVAAAMQVAGTNGIVHRDIKPENILLTKKGEAKVADFGLAQLTQHGERVTMTQVGVTMGTPLYMSPEQVAGKPLDHRSDIYSFGAMAYHMLAGRPPFQGETALAVAVQHMNEKPELLRKIRPDLPQPICDLVHKMMAKRKEDRYDDAQALLNDLKALQKQLSGKDGGPPAPLPAARRALLAHRWSSGGWDSISRKQLLGMLLVGLLVGGATAGFGWTQRVGDPFLTPPAPSPPVPLKSNIEAQYFHAMTAGDNEAAWKAVVDFRSIDGGRDELPRKVGELRLALIYLQHDRWDEADRIFKAFQLAGVSDPWKKAHGLAGIAIVQLLRGETQLAALTLKELDRLNPTLDTKLKQALDDARETLKSRERPGPPPGPPGAPPLP